MEKERTSPIDENLSEHNYKISLAFEKVGIKILLSISHD